MNGRVSFQKRGQYFISVHNETLSVIAVCTDNPDRLPVGVMFRSVGTGFDFPLLAWKRRPRLLLVEKFEHPLVNPHASP